MQFDEPSLVPSWRAYFRHGIFLAITFFTATIAGTLFPFGPIDTLPQADPQTWSEFAELIFSLPAKYVLLIGTVFESVAADPGLLLYGVCFSSSLLFILVSHELAITSHVVYMALKQHFLTLSRRRP